MWECEPGRAGQGALRPALGSFSHEAVAVDPVERRLYMTEDQPDGGLYRFTPPAYPDLSAGLLEVLLEAGGWAPLPDPAAITGPTRGQVAGMRRFSGGEGIWYDGGSVYFSTKGHNRVWEYEVASGALSTVYDGGGPLTGVDNLTVSRAGEVFVCEDGGNMEICVIEPGGIVAPFLRLTGEAATGLPERGNELAGVVFDPSGDRLYFAAQRAYGFGVVYEVTGPFRRGAAARAPVAAGAPRAAGPRGLRVRAAAADLARRAAALQAACRGRGRRAVRAARRAAPRRPRPRARRPRLDRAAAHGHARPPPRPHADPSAVPAARERRRGAPAARLAAADAPGRRDRAVGATVWCGVAQRRVRLR